MTKDFNAAKDLEYFKEFKLKYPEVLKDFIRQQLAVATKDSIATLEYLRSLMPAEEMNLIVVTLNDQDRLAWKSTIGREKTIIDPARLMDYAKGEMMKAFVASRPMVDPELLELTLKLRTHDVVRFGELYPDDMGELLNLLNPVFISKILDKLDVEKAEKFLAVALEAGLPGGKTNNLKDNLKKFLNVTQKNSMASKLAKVLEGVEPSKEKMIYSHMLKMSSTEDLIETAVKNCPLDVVWLLPKSALNDILQAYPLQKKARLFVSLDQEKKKILMEASSAEGSSAREMIDMELKQIEENPQELRRCQAAEGALTLEFLRFLRQHTQNSEQVLSDVRLACHIWFSELAVAESSHSSSRAA